MRIHYSPYDYYLPNTETDRALMLINIHPPV